MKRTIRGINAMIVRGALTTLTAGVLVFGVVAQAHAGAKAFALLRISEFALWDMGGTAVGTAGGAAGTTQVDVSDFSAASFTTGARNTANLTVAVPNAADSGLLTESVSIAGGVQTGFPPPGALLDPGVACVGAVACAAVPILENEFFQHPTPPPAEFARADSRVTGSPITGLVDNAVAPAPIPTPATADTVAEIQLLGNNSGGANADINVTSTFNFAFTLSGGAAGVADVAFQFDGTPIVESFLNPLTLDGSLAQSTIAFNINLQFTDPISGAFVDANWVPNALPDLAIFFPGLVTEEVDLATLNTTRGADFLNKTPAIYAPGTNTYRLRLALPTGVLITGSIGHTSFAKAEKKIPEPASLALLGAGLLALGMVRRRRRQAA